MICTVLDHRTNGTWTIKVPYFLAKEEKIKTKIDPTYLGQLIKARGLKLWPLLEILETYNHLEFIILTSCMVHHVLLQTAKLESIWN